MGHISIVQVNSPALLDLYVKLPYDLYKNHPGFTPFLLSEERNFLNPLHNLALRSSETTCFIAFQNERPAGRIMCIIHHDWNTRNNEKTARFFQFDCINSQRVANHLLQAVEQWAKERGMLRMIGPFGFSDKDPEGLQIEGFEYLPAISTVTNPPYLVDLLSSCGYDKFKDCISYSVDLTKPIPDSYSAIAERIMSKGNLKLLEFRKRSELKTHFKSLMGLLNSGYTGLYGFVPMSPQEIDHMTAEYLGFLDPRLVKIIIDKNQEPMAFVIAMPNLARGLRKARGRLIPAGFLQLMYDLKFSKKLDLLLGAVKQEHHGMGLTAVLAISLIKTAKSMKMTSMDSHLILEENRRMCSEMEHIGGRPFKRYRIFQRLI